MAYAKMDAPSVRDHFLSIFIYGVEHFFGGAEGIDGRRHAGINAGLEKDLRDFLARDSIIQGAADVQFDFMRAIQRREHGQINEASALAGKAGPGPNRAPAPFGDEFIKYTRELVRGSHG